MSRPVYDDSVLDETPINIEESGVFELGRVPDCGNSPDTPDETAASATENRQSADCTPHPSHRCDSRSRELLNNPFPENL